MDLLKARIALALLPALALAAPKSAVLIDRSGSMKPYYLDHTVHRLGETLLEALRAQGDVTIYAFGDQAQPVRSLEEIERLPYGNNTLLDKSLDKAAKDGAEIVWMITDNIQDPPGSMEAGSTEQFYKKLRSDAVENVTIFPLRQPVGRPGLLIYSLLIKGGDSDLYWKGLAGFRSRATGILHTDALRMKPLDRDTVGINWVRANVNPRTSLITYETGKPVKETLKIKFKSKFDHIEIEDSSIEVVQGEATFGKDSLVYPERRVIGISPRTVQRLGPGDETEQVYTVDVDLGALKLRNDVASLWKAAWVKSSEDATLQLAFLIRVPQKNFHLRLRFLQEFHATTVQEARTTGKVYAVDRLPSLMSNEVTEIRVASPVVFRVKYPFYPTFLWISLFAVAVLIVIGALVAVKRGAGWFTRRSWQVEARTQAGVPLDCAVEGDKVLVQRDTVGHINQGDFTPGHGVRIVQPPGNRVKLADSLEATVEAGRRLVVLKFKTKEDASKPAVAAAAAPPRRR
jgi:hypothetical protein